MTADLQFPGDGLAAALIQLSGQAERIGHLDARESGHHEEVPSQLNGLAAEAAAVKSRVDGIRVTLARQSAIVTALEGLDTQVAELARSLAHRTGPGDDAGYQPEPQLRWWKLRGPDRDTAVSRLRAWVEQIYRPGYGQIAATLRARVVGIAAVAAGWVLILIDGG
jgi:hypothetical protein